MERPHYLAMTTDRRDVADWLNEMIGNGWKLVTADQGIFYFEHLEMLAASLSEVLIRDQGMKDLLNTAAEVGIERAKRG